MQNTGLYQEFQIGTTENVHPEEIPEDKWVEDHPLWWQTINFLENFGALPSEAFIQERERIDDVLTILNEPPQTSNDVGAWELACKQHSMWIAELLDNSWSANVSANMSSFEEETEGNGILLFYVFLHENVRYTKEAIIAAEQQLSKEKLSLENFYHNIGQFTKHAYIYLRKNMNAVAPINNQHYILNFSALKETED